MKHIAISLTLACFPALFAAGEPVRKTAVSIVGDAFHINDKPTYAGRETRAIPGYRPMPILFNEEDHFDFDKPDNFTAAIGAYASWGYFDFRRKGESFNDGFQSVPVNWELSSPRKRAFFQLLADITGSSAGREGKAKNQP